MKEGAGKLRRSEEKFQSFSRKSMISFRNIKVSDALEIERENSQEDEANRRSTSVTQSLNSIFSIALIIKVSPIQVQYPFKFIQRNSISNRVEKKVNNENVKRDEGSLG